MPLACAFHDSWLSNCGKTSSPIKEVGPTVVHEAAFADDLLAGAFHDAGSDWQSALPAEVAAHSALVDLAVTHAGHDLFRPAAVRLQIGDDFIDLPRVQLVLDRLHPIRPFALARRHGFHIGATYWRA